MDTLAVLCLSNFSALCAHDGSAAFVKVQAAISTESQTVANSPVASKPISSIACCRY